MLNNDKNLNFDDIEPRGVEKIPQKTIIDQINEKLIEMGKVEMSLYDVKETKEVLVALAKLASASKAAMDDDGKITLLDAAKFVGVLFPLIDGLTGINRVPKEMSDLQPEEKKELIEAVKDTLELADNDVAAVEAALSAIFSLVEFFKIVGVIKPIEPGI